jgi:hypothetical protein
VTPEDRHARRDTALLAARHAVYAAARINRPERWSGRTRNWDPITDVTLNPEHAVESSPAHIAA